MKKAFITGVAGQDGSYLAEFLLEKGYEVHGLIRSTSMFNRRRIEHIIKNPILTRCHPMLRPRYMRIILQTVIRKPMDCIFVTEYCLITSLREEVKTLFQEK